MALTLSQLAEGCSEETLNSKNAFSEAFSKMQLIRRQGKLCDITICAGTSRFTAHRIVLAATIPYFNRMFTSGMCEEHKEKIEIHDVDETALETLINFAYTGVLTIDVNTAGTVLLGANYFLMDNVKHFCCEFIKRHVNACNVLGVRTFGKALMSFPLVKKADSFLHQHFVDVAKSDEFLRLSKDEVLELLSSNELNVASEEEVFLAASNWVMFDFEERSKMMHELLSCVRLTLLKPHFLADVVQLDVACKACLKCRDLVDRAKDYHLMPERRSDFPPNLVIPRYCSEIVGTIYVVGGLSSHCDALNTVERYLPLLDRWEQVASMSCCRSRLGVAVLNGKLYAAGGYDGNERQNTAEVYSPGSDEWNPIAPMGLKRSALGCCACDGKVYVCGGFDGRVSLSSCEVYQPHTQEWKPIQSMNKARSAMAVTCFDGCVWVMGGHDGLIIFNSVEFYNPQTEKWSMTTPMLSKRSRHGATSLRDKIYVFGGYDGREFLLTCEMYDQVSGQFTYINSMMLRRSRVGVTVSGSMIYCLGGYDGSLNLKSVEIYDTEKEVWKKGKSMVAHDGGVGVATIIPDI